MCFLWEPRLIYMVCPTSGIAFSYCLFMYHIFFSFNKYFFCYYMLGTTLSPSNTKMPLIRSLFLSSKSSQKRQTSKNTVSRVASAMIEARMECSGAQNKSIKISFGQGSQERPSWGDDTYTALQDKQKQLERRPRAFRAKKSVCQSKEAHHCDISSSLGWQGGQGADHKGS